MTATSTALGVGGINIISTYSFSIDATKYFEQLINFLKQPVILAEILNIFAGIILLIMFFNFKYKKDKEFLFKLKTYGYIGVYVLEALFAAISFFIILKANLELNHSHASVAAILSATIIMTIFIIIAYYFMIEIQLEETKNKDSKFFKHKSLFLVAVFIIFLVNNLKNGDTMDYSRLFDLNYIFTQLLDTAIFNVFMIFFFLFVAFAFIAETEDEKKGGSAFFVGVLLPVLGGLILGFIILLFFFVVILILRLGHSSPDDFDALYLSFRTLAEVFGYFLPSNTMGNILLLIMIFGTSLPLIKKIIKIFNDYDDDKEITFNLSNKILAWIGVIIIFFIFSLYYAGVLK